MRKIFILGAMFLALAGCSLFNKTSPNQPDINLELSQPVNEAVNLNSLPEMPYAEISAAVNSQAAEWVTDWQKYMPDFNPDNFKFSKSAPFTLGPVKDYQKTLTALEKRFYSFAPDQSRYLDVYGDIDVYEFDGRLRYENATVEFGPILPDDFVDPNYREPAIVDVIKNKSQSISGVDYSSIRNSLWLSDQEFVLTGSRVVADGLIPFVIYFNLQKLTYAEYEGDLIPSCKMVGNCPEDMMTLKLYYTGCLGRVTKEYERQVPKSKEVAKTALQQLFYGPRPEEKEAGQEYLFDGPNYIILKDVKIIDNIAYVNLNDIRSLFSNDGPYSGMENFTKRNCEEFSFFEQATRTLKQFSNIKDAVYFIEGNSSFFYAFLGINCPSGLCQNNPYQDTMDSIYIFSNECNDPVRSYLRLIPKGSDKIKATLTELFKGPAKYETQPGRYYMFSHRTADILKDIVIKDQIAYVNLANFTQIVPYPDWRCNAPQFFASVGATLTQFPEIKDAIYYINGSQETFYKYMKVECPYPKECATNPFK